MTLLDKIMVAGKNNFSSNTNAKHNFAKRVYKVISKCKNDKPWKNKLNRKSASPPPPTTPFFHLIFLIVQIPPPPPGDK